MLGYIKLAERMNIIDRPVSRSSHIHPTVRGGGIIFPIAAAIWFIIFGWEQTYTVIGLLITSLVSFLDDLKSLSRSIRLAIHLFAISLLFYEFGLFQYHWYLILSALILTIGWINAFNFMDGINAITAFYSLVLLGTFSLLNNADKLLLPFFKSSFADHWVSFFPGGLVGALFISVLIFTFFNARKRALAFAGDIGSISMAFMQLWMMISLMVATKQAYWIVLFSVYGIDTIITIIIRIKKGENIFESHRQHLYQLLVNEKKWSHLKVSLTYGSTQLITNLAVIYLVFTNKMNLAVCFYIIVLMTISYILIRRRIILTLT